MRRAARGFTLVEVLVALMVVALGLAALMVAVSGTARTSGYLRDKTLAQWIALNRIAEVRLNPGSTALTATSDPVELDFGGRKWHYDTRFFDTSIKTMKRVVVRVYAGDKKTKGNPLADSTSFYSTALATPGGSNVDWTAGSTLASAQSAAAGTGSTPPAGPAGPGPAGAAGSGTSSPPATTPTTTTP